MERIRLIICLVLFLGLVASPIVLAKTVYSDTRFSMDQWTDTGTFFTPNDAPNGVFTTQLGLEGLFHYE